MVAPPGDRGAGLLLTRAASDAQREQVGKQAGGRVAFFLRVEDFASRHQSMRAAGVKFLEQPRHEPSGTVVQFADLYGNRWDLIQPASRD